MKEAYYFSHDANARNDERLIEVRIKYDWWGYGVYFGIVECLREATGYKLQLSKLDNLAYSLNVDAKKFAEFFEFCHKVGLIAKDEEYFWSASLKRRMKKATTIRKQRIKAGLEGAKKRWQKDGKCQGDGLTENGKGKESKVKEIKESIYKVVPPTYEQVRQYFLDNNYKEIEADKFYNYYESKDWMVGKNKMKDWGAAVRNWKSNIEDRGGTILNTVDRILTEADYKRMHEE